MTNFVNDSEAHSGVRILRHIARTIRDSLDPYVEKYGENKDIGIHTAHHLRDALFPEHHENNEFHSLEVLGALRGMQVYLAHVEASLTALVPVSQAIWDKEYFETVKFSLGQLKRVQDWVTQQIKVRAPQTLLVPAKVPRSGQ